MLALPETLLQAIDATLEDEIGPAKSLVQFQCGRWWGKTFYRRFTEEVSDYYGRPLAQMEMIAFLQCLKQCWKTYGWGIIDLDVNYYQQGFLVAKIWNAPFAQVAHSQNRPRCFTEAGLLSGFFSALTGQDLHCVQTTCESLGAECNHFVLGLEERVKVAEAWLEEGHDHDTIMARLCSNQPFENKKTSDAPQASKRPEQLDNVLPFESPVSSEPSEPEELIALSDGSDMESNSLLSESPELPEQSTPADLSRRVRFYAVRPI